MKKWIIGLALASVLLVIGLVAVMIHVGESVHIDTPKEITHHVYSSNTEPTFNLTIGNSSGSVGVQRMSKH